MNVSQELALGTLKSESKTAMEFFCLRDEMAAEERLGGITILPRSFTGSRPYIFPFFWKISSSN